MNNNIRKLNIDSHYYLKVRNYLIDFYGIGDNEFEYATPMNIPHPKELTIYVQVDEKENIRNFVSLFTDDKHIEKLLEPISEETFYNITWTMVFVGHWLNKLHLVSDDYENDPDPEIFYHDKIYKELLLLYKLCFAMPYKRLDNNPIKISISEDEDYNRTETFNNFDNHILRCAIGEYCKKHLPNIKSVKDANNALRLLTPKGGRKQSSPYVFPIIYGTYRLLKSLTKDKKVASTAICKVIGRYLLFLGLVTEDYADPENICGIIKYILKQKAKPYLPGTKHTDLKKKFKLYADIYTTR